MPPGAYHLTLHKKGEGQFVLQVHKARAAIKAKLDASMSAEAVADVQIPLVLEEQELCRELSAGFALHDGGVRLRIQFGPHLLTTSASLLPKVK